MTPLPLKTPAPPQGIIAALATGFELVNARLELILLPLALDLFLWLGPHLSIKPLVSALALGVQAELATLDSGQSEATTRAVVNLVVTYLNDFGARFNLFSFLSSAPLGMPSLLAGRGPVGVPGGAPVVWYIASVPQYVLLMGIMILAGLFIGALYLGGIAQQVRDRRVRWLVLLRQVWGDWARLTALGAVGLFVILALGVPIFFVTGLVSIFSLAIGQIVWVIGVSVVLWVLFYGGFALHGMFMHRRNLFAALWDSARLVQLNLPSAAGLFLLILLINFGLSGLWNLPADDSWLLLLGLAGHALISTALVTATFVFYQDRLRWWIEMRQALQAKAAGDDKRGLKPKA